MNNFGYALDWIDAAVQTGDTLYGEEDFKLFKEYVARWSRLITEHEKTTEEEDNEIKI
jgi:hypothetical protein